MDFLNKVVLITECSSSIGAETAKYMARRGAELSLAGRSDSILYAVASDCKKLGSREMLLTTSDLTGEEQIKSLIDRTIDKFGKLDVLVNTGGIFQFGSTEGPDLIKQCNSIYSINVRPVIFLINSAIPYLEKTKGNIVNLSSIAGIKSLPNLLSYSMSKSSLNQITRCTALELASKQIRVNAVNPGTMDPPIYDINNLGSGNYFEKMKSLHPLGRLGTAQEVASVIGFLASEEASFITGTTISVDGGRHCMSSNPLICQV